MRAAREQEAALRRQQGGNAADSKAAARADFRDMFVSLVDPAGLLDMEKCAETAGRMRRSALESGYRAGADMSSSLAGIFADIADISGRPVDDGVLCHTYMASSWMLEVLYDTAEAYRAGGEDEPVGWLEDVRGRIARIMSDADKFQEKVRSADPPGSALPPIDACHSGKICRDVIRVEQEEVRARQKARGRDPIFPPKPKTLAEILGDNYEPDLTSADMIDISRGRCPEGYELVKIEGHERWTGERS